MPWKELLKMDQKKEFVLESLKSNTNFTKLCAKYCISTKTGYKWKERFLERGFEGLNELSKRPKVSPQKLTEDVLLEIIRIKNKKKNWGSRKIKSIYSNLHPDKIAPSTRTIDRILKKAGLIKPKKVRRKESGVRIENKVAATYPNHIWTVDFKGWWYTTSKEKVNPLTVRDEFSKYILTIKALDKGDILCVYQEFDNIFKIYGLPEIIRSDNGPPFANMSSLFGLTKLSVWWMALGIKLDRIEPGKPYQNGAHERMHLDMRNELEGQIDGDIRYHQKVFEDWRKEFNEERPHESLRMKTPAMVYKVSEITYEPGLIEFEYPKNYKSRNVNSRGFVNYKGKRYFIGNPFNGYNVGIDIDKTGQLNVWFGNNLIGYFDKETLLIIPEKNDNFKIRKKRKVLPMS
jgi:transposase InsO family protein